MLSHGVAGREHAFSHRGVLLRVSPQHEEGGAHAFRIKSSQHARCSPAPRAIVERETPRAIATAQIVAVNPITWSNSREGPGSLDSHTPLTRHAF